VHYTSDFQKKEKTRNNAGVTVTTYNTSSATVYKFREPEPPGDLRACPGMYRDFLTLLSDYISDWKIRGSNPYRGKEFSSLRRADRPPVQWLETFLPRK
jgi:hypothetical protein